MKYYGAAHELVRRSVGYLKAQSGELLHEHFLAVNDVDAFVWTYPELALLGLTMVKVMGVSATIDPTAKTKEGASLPLGRGV